MTAAAAGRSGRTVYVRGAGVVGVLGNGAETVLRALARPPVPPASPGVAGPPLSAQFEPADLPGGLGRRLGRQPALVLAAVLDALGSQRPASDAALVLSTAHGAMAESIVFLSGAAVHGAAAASPLSFASSLHNAMAGAVGRALDLRGPAIAVSNGGTSFESALLVAVSLLRSGHARQAIVGGSDAQHPVFSRGLRKIGLLAEPDAAADAATGLSATGYPGAEGGGALLLEADEPARPGVVLEDVALGGACRLPDGEVERVHWLCTGTPRSEALHRKVWERLAARLPRGRSSSAMSGAMPGATFPSRHHGVFGSLSAVAVAVEAARRLRLGTAPSGGTVLLQAADRTSPATVVLGGGGCG